MWITMVTLSHGVSFLQKKYINTNTADKKKSRTAEQGKFTLYLYIRLYTT